jgi:hypothetical protein
MSEEIRERYVSKIKVKVKVKVKVSSRLLLL